MTAHHIPMSRWEYNTVIFEESGWFPSGGLDGKKFQAKLDELGTKGWELTSVFATERVQGGTRQVVAVFKRPLG